jgi:hypothetical protein
MAMSVVATKTFEGSAYILDSRGDVWKFSMWWDGQPRIESVKRGSGKVTDDELSDFLK